MLGSGPVWVLQKERRIRWSNGFGNLVPKLSEWNTKLKLQCHFSLPVTFVHIWKHIQKGKWTGPPPDPWSGLESLDLFLISSPLWSQSLARLENHCSRWRKSDPQSTTSQVTHVANGGSLPGAQVYLPVSPGFFHNSLRPLGAPLTQETRTELSVSVRSHLCSRDKNSWPYRAIAKLN